MTVKVPGTRTPKKLAVVRPTGLDHTHRPRLRVGMDLEDGVRYRFGMFARLTIQIALVALITASPMLAEARFFRSEQVPNGQKLDCALCHIASNGNGPRNDFGIEMEQVGLDGNGEVQNQNVVWSALCMLDSDADGFTNGHELGDPECEWETGDNDPSVFPSFPGDPDSVPCGNGSVHPDEECDGEDFADATCQSLGFVGGDLACNADCTFDTSACMAAPDMGMGGMSDVGQGDGDAGTTTGAGPDAGATTPQSDTGQSTPGQTNQNGGPGSANPHPYFDNPPPTGASGPGCGGSLEVRESASDSAATTADAGATDGSMLLLLPLLGLRRRRARG